MDLRNGSIKVKEVLSVIGSESILKKHFPQLPMFLVKMNKEKILHDGMVNFLCRLRKATITRYLVKYYSGCVCEGMFDEAEINI